MESRIVPIENADPYLKLLVFGRNKQGKTRFAATAPNPIIADVNERGTKSARDQHGAKVFAVNQWEDIDHLYWYLRRADHEFESVVIDTLTNLQHMCMAHVLGEAEDRDPNRPPSMPDRRAWGQLAELMKPMVYKYRNLPMHVIFVTQERNVDDEESGTTERVPDLSPGTRGVAMGAVDIIGRIYQKEVRTVDKAKKRERKEWEARMLVGPHEEYATGGRTIALGRIIRKPTVPDILEVLEAVDGDEA